jgi:type I restriction enzyme S subunit
MVRGGDIKHGRINEDLPRISADKSVEYQRTVLQPGDVVIALVGYPGEAAVVPSSLSGANISRAVGLLRPRFINSRFLACYLNSPGGRVEFLRPGAGSAQLVVNLRDLNNLVVPVPPAAVQEAIAGALSDADAYIESLESQFAKKRAVKLGAMQELLTGKRRLPGFEVKPGLKQSEVGRIPEDWAVTTIAAEFSVDLGKMLDAEKNLGVPKPFIGNRAVQWGKVNLSEIGSIKLTSADVQRYRLVKGDLIVCEGGEVGRCAIWDDGQECYYQKALHRLRSKRGYSVLLMRYLLEHMASSGQLTSFVTQTSIAHLPKDKMETIAVPMPHQLEQEAIASFLSDMESELDELEAKVRKARDIKQGMLQELLTGRVRLV